MPQGGKRPNSGRKKLPETVFKEQELAYRVDQARKSFEFVCKLRDNPNVHWGLRLDAAKDIQDRIFGKPKQALEHSGTLNLEQILAESSPPVKS